MAETNIDESKLEGSKEVLEKHLADLEAFPISEEVRTAFLGVLQSKEGVTKEALEGLDTSGDYEADQTKALLLSTIGEDEFLDIVADADQYINGSFEGKGTPVKDFANFLADTKEKHGEAEGVKNFFGQYMSELEQDGVIKGIVQGLDGDKDLEEGLDAALDDGDPTLEVENKESEVENPKKEKEKKEDSEVDPHKYKKDTLVTAIGLASFFVPMVGPLLSLAIAAAYVNYRSAGSEGKEPTEAEQEEMQGLKEEVYAEMKGMRGFDLGAIANGAIAAQEVATGGGPQDQEEFVDVPSSEGFLEAGHNAAARVQEDIADAEALLEGAAVNLEKAALVARRAAPASKGAEVTAGSVPPPSELAADPAETSPSPEVLPQDANQKWTDKFPAKGSSVEPLAPEKAPPSGAVAQEGEGGSPSVGGR